MSNEQVKDVYTIVKNGEKAFWQKVGRAHVNKDGSWNVYLNALPLNGELNIREPRPKRPSGALTSASRQEAVFLRDGRLFFYVKPAESFKALALWPSHGKGCRSKAQSL